MGRELKAQTAYARGAQGMDTTITITRKRGVGYRRTLAGQVDVCCHQVSYWYDITGMRLVDGTATRLEAEAEDRAKDCIIEGYWSGELCCVVGGEREVHGWWQIVQNQGDC